MPLGIQSTHRMKTGIIMLVIGAVAILVTTFLTNGAEKDTVWLYIFAVGMVLMASIEGSSLEKKDKTSKAFIIRFRSSEVGVRRPFLLFKYLPNRL